MIYYISYYFICLLYQENTKCSPPLSMDPRKLYSSTYLSGIEKKTCSAFDYLIFCLELYIILTCLIGVTSVLKFPVVLTSIGVNIIVSFQ